MKKIRLDGDIYIDLVKLIASKLFIYANSGFGKSWLLRWFLEQTFGHIQQIIIDPEGEFSTLREKFDYILIGKGKEFDIQADPRTAALLAHRLLEEKVSAIIDLYELEPLEREAFVANFTNALVNVPKTLHHPYLYVVDEAQDFAPEKGDALSSKALHSIAKKGRKRGCCPIFATQRVSDFSKSVIAACNNKLIGQASLDIDMKRCAAELGFTTKEQILSLRDLDPGEFFAFGPAITKVVTKVKIGQVRTTHPDSSKMGSKIGTKVVPASAKVKKALAKLADLPQEAAKEAQTTKELKEALTVARRQITVLQRDAKQQTIDPDALKKLTDKAYDLGVAAVEHTMRKEIKKVQEGAYTEMKKALEILQKISRLTTPFINSGIGIEMPKIEIEIPPPVRMPGRDAKSHAPIVLPNYPRGGHEPNVFRTQPTPDGMPLQLARHRDVGLHGIADEAEMEQKELSKGAKAVLSYLHSVYPHWKTKTQLWVAAGYAPGGGFNNLVYELTGAGLIEKDANGRYASLERRDSSLWDIDESFQASLSIWDPKLSLGARKILQMFIKDSDLTFTKNVIATETGYAQGGGFNNLIYELTGKELAIKVGDSYQVNPEILDL